MTRLPPISLSEFAARTAVHRGVGSSGGGVSALVTSTAATSSLAHELKDELEFVAQCPTSTVQVADNPVVALDAIAQARGSLVILHTLATLGAQGWARMDELRNRLESVEGLVLLIAPEDLELLQRHAPNLSSWLGGRVYSYADGPLHLAPAEVQRRLATLRSAFGKTDDEVLALARTNDLPPEPEYAEWLILLGHGGLLP